LLPVPEPGQGTETLEDGARDTIDSGGNHEPIVVDAHVSFIASADNSVPSSGTANGPRSASRSGSLGTLDYFNLVIDEGWGPGGGTRAFVGARGFEVPPKGSQTAFHCLG
jgi:hypothetical protein